MSVFGAGLLSGSDEKPLELALVIHSLAGGGAERVLAAMANHLSTTNRVHLITLDRAEHDQFELSGAVRRIALDEMVVSTNAVAAIQNNRRRIQRMRVALQQISPDVVVSFGDKTNVVTLLASKRLATPVVVCERTDPRHHEIGRVWSWLRRLSYPRAAALVVQTSGLRKLARRFGTNQRVEVIPNFVDVPSQCLDEASCHRNLSIVAAGRLSPEKGFDRLIRSFLEIADRHPDWRLVIFGEGSERERLEAMAEPLGDRIVLPGWTNDLPARYCEASVFALPSHYEGFPNALLEAMSCGLSPVCFNCPSGPADIVRDQVDGLLVAPDDEPAFAAGLDQLMSDHALRWRLSQQARTVSERFSQESFFQKWARVFDGVLQDTTASRF